MTRLPVVTLQILQQRNALLEPLQILGHGAAIASRVELRRKAAAFPGKDGGRRSFLNSQRPEAGEKREYSVRAERQRIVHEDRRPAEPRADGLHGLAQEREPRL